MFGRLKKILSFNAEPFPVAASAVQLLGWRFEPKADITAYEIALILQRFGGSVHGEGVGTLSPLYIGRAPHGQGPRDLLPPGASRHFVRAREADEWRPVWE